MQRIGKVPTRNCRLCVAAGPCTAEDPHPATAEVPHCPLISALSLSMSLSAHFGGTLRVRFLKGTLGLKKTMLSLAAR